MNHGETFRVHPKRYAILLNKGYIGIEHVKSQDINNTIREMN